MKILVVGGAGYIGSQCVCQLLQQNYEVVVLDNLSTGSRKNIAKDAIFILGDMNDSSLLDTIFINYKIEAIFQFAASISVGESVLKPLEYYDNNVDGVKSILKAMLRHNIDKIIFSSTAAVYGSAGTELVTEMSPISPQSPYGESKYVAEQLIRYCGIAHDIKYVILRYFNVAGASSDTKRGVVSNNLTHLIPIINEVALGLRDSLKIYGDDYPTDDGTCIRDYIHVEDLIDGHILGLEYLISNGKSETINLGTSHGYSVKEVVNTAIKVLKKQINYQITSRREGDAIKIVASNEKALAILGWKPKLGLKEMLQSDYNFRSKLQND